MFKTNPDGMRMEPTPERVFALCRMIAYKRMTNEELRTSMTLGSNDESAIGQINASLSVAIEELHILRRKDNFIEFAADKSVIASPVNFRRYVASIVFQQKDTTFYLFSKWIISKNDELFKLSNWEVMAKTCSSEIAELSKVNENAVLGWRFWAAYLGLGYLNKTMFLPNMKIRIQDVLATEYENTFNYDEQVRSTEFISWLSSKIPEADTSGRLPLAVSAALRTLDELDLIHLETWRDSNRTMMFYVDGDKNDFSHITVRKEIAL